MSLGATCCDDPNVCPGCGLSFCGPQCPDCDLAVDSKAWRLLKGNGKIFTWKLMILYVFIAYVGMMFAQPWTL